MESIQDVWCLTPLFRHKPIAWQRLLDRTPGQLKPRSAGRELFCTPAVVPIIFVVGQTIADYVLSPYLVGRRVNLHPV